MTMIGIAGGVVVGIIVIIIVCKACRGNKKSHGGADVTEISSVRTADRGKAPIKVHDTADNWNESNVKGEILDIEDANMTNAKLTQ